ncbi:hypothetical protein RRF57_003511 [Xylaria bambusicola]|uniref:SRP9 domain-containing protein n=1 Tax=Xylaria bambusicola TaxID=326684 RepID=A0AAN7UKC1_9PEZI
MPYYESSQEWLRQSALLIEARPSTVSIFFSRFHRSNQTNRFKSQTRITTNYHLTDKTGSSKKRQKRRQQALEEAKQQFSSNTTATTQAQPRASLTIKTYDPCSGACLKYRTTKAAEVSRLILSIGQLGRKMAALPADTATTTTDAVMGDAEEVVPEKVETTTSSATTAATGGNAKGQAPTQQGQGQTGSGGGGGGKGKKKRGKK